MTEGIIGCGHPSPARLVRHPNQSVRQRRSVTGSNRSLRFWGKIVDKVGHFLVRSSSSTVLVRTRAMYRPSLGVSQPRGGLWDKVWISWALP